MRGNHEQLLLEFLDDPSILAAWRHCGGLETLCSYGVDVHQPMRGAGFQTARDELAKALPEVHRRFLEAMEPSLVLGDYFFCHAGARPGVRLEDQTVEDLLWIREGFLDRESPFGKVIVHGHTPTARLEIKANRINIDTGAFATSRLSCLVLEGDRQRFLTVGADQFVVETPLQSLGDRHAPQDPIRDGAVATCRSA